MRVIDKPSYTPSYSPIVGQQVAMKICLPDGYNTTDKWPWMIFCHGMGQRGPGTLSALNTAFEGQFAGLPDDWKIAVDKYGIIGVMVNYNEFFQPQSWEWVYNYIKTNYSVADLCMQQGFSWGGGSIQKDYCTPGGAKVACAIPIAPTIEMNSGWANVGADNLPVCIMVNKGDDNGPTNLSVTKSSVAAINASSPKIPAVYIAFDANGHGGTTQALGIAPPQGALENVYEWYKDILRYGKRQIKLGTLPPPVEPQPPTQPSVVKAIVSYSEEPTLVKLIGNKSTGYKTGYEGVWVFEAGPANLSAKDVFPSGSSFINATALLPKAGTYTFRFNLKVGAASDTTTVTINHGIEVPPTEKVPVNFSFISKLLQFDDGSLENCTSVTFKTLSGKEYTI